MSINWLEKTIYNSCHFVLCGFNDHIVVVLLKDSSWWLMLLVAYLWLLLQPCFVCADHECSTIFCSKRKAGIIFFHHCNLPHGLPSSLISCYHLPIPQLSGMAIMWLGCKITWISGAKFSGNNFSARHSGFLFPILSIDPYSGWKQSNLWQLVSDQLVGAIYIWCSYLDPVGTAGFLFCLPRVFSFLSGCIHWVPDGSGNIIWHWMKSRNIQLLWAHWIIFAFNICFHNEPPWFPSVPWNKLPEIKRENAWVLWTTKAHRSGHHYSFSLIKNSTLHSRMLRKEKVRIPVKEGRILFPPKWNFKRRTSAFFRHLCMFKL